MLLNALTRGPAYLAKSASKRGIFDTRDRKLLSKRRLLLAVRNPFLAVGFVTSQIGDALAKLRIGAISIGNSIEADYRIRLQAHANIRNAGAILKNQLGFRPAAIDGEGRAVWGARGIYVTAGTREEYLSEGDGGDQHQRCNQYGFHSFSKGSSLAHSTMAKPSDQGKSV